MKKYINLFLWISLQLWASDIFAQETAAQSSPTKSWAIQLNVQHQDLALQISFGQLGVAHQVRIRPVYSMGIQRFTQKKASVRTFWSGQIAFYNNLYQDRLLHGSLGAVVERWLTKSLFISTRIESGVAFVRNADVQYELENGLWIPSNNFSKTYTVLVVGPRLDIGYKIIDQAHPIEIIAMTKLTANISSRIGFLPYYAAGVGVRWGFCSIKSSGSAKI